MASRRSLRALSADPTTYRSTGTTTETAAAGGLGRVKSFDREFGMPQAILTAGSYGEDASKLKEDHACARNSISPSHSRGRPSNFVLHVTAIASLGGILFGYDLGVISGALPQLIQTFDLSRQQQELCVSILYLGGGFGAALGGSLCDSFGRKRSIVLCDIIFAAGAFLLYIAPTFAFVVGGRIVVGFAIALSGIADVTYLHEIAPVHYRGAIVSVNEACIALGFLLAFWVGRSLSADETGEGWRSMFGFSGIIAIVQFLGMLPLPESPKWLAECGRHDESAIAQRRIQGDYVIFQPSSSSIDTGDSDLAGTSSSAVISVSYQAASPPPSTLSTENVDRKQRTIAPRKLDFSTAGDTTSTSGAANGSSCSRILLYSCCQCGVLYKQFQVFILMLMTDFRRQTYITLFLAVTQQLCGQANVLSYAPLIFAAASGKDSTASSVYVQGWATLSIGLVKFVVTVGVIWKIESLGRRLLLLVGMGTIVFGLLLLAVAFAGASVVPSAAQDEGTEVADASNGFYLALPGVLLVVCGYSMSFGPLTWLLTSELFPTDIRGRALGFSTIITYLCASLVTYTFLSAQALMGASIVFLVYLMITGIGLVFALLAIPDTGGKNSEEIEVDLDAMLWWQRKQSMYTSTRPLDTPLAETEIT